VNTSKPKLDLCKFKRVEYEAKAPQTTKVKKNYKAKIDLSTKSNTNQNSNKKSTENSIQENRNQLEAIWIDDCKLYQTLYNICHQLISRYHSNIL
jgi:hypothetical protein